MTIDLNPLFLTSRLAVLTALFLFVLTLPLAFWIWKTRSPFKTFVQAIITLPLVLPPVVIGFYLLLLFSPSYSIGQFLDNWFNIRLVFTFEGLLVASILFNVPFMVNPIVSGLEALPKSLTDASYTLGKGPIATFLRVQLPAIRPSILTGFVLTFAHTIGEFGVVLMIGGKIPGITRVASIAIYDEVESMNYAAAHIYSLVLVAISFIILFVLIHFNRRYKNVLG